MKDTMRSLLTGLHAKTTNCILSDHRNTRPRMQMQSVVTKCRMTSGLYIGKFKGLNHPQINNNILRWEVHWHFEGCSTGPARLPGPCVLYSHQLTIKISQTGRAGLPSLFSQAHLLTNPKKFHMQAGNCPAFL